MLEDGCPQRAHFGRGALRCTVRLIHLHCDLERIILKTKGSGCQALQRLWPDMIGDSGGLLELVGKGMSMHGQGVCVCVGQGVLYMSKKENWVVLSVEEGNGKLVAAKFPQYDIIGPPDMPDGLLMSIDLMLATNISWTYKAQSTTWVTLNKKFSLTSNHAQRPPNWGQRVHFSACTLLWENKKKVLPYVWTINIDKTLSCWNVCVLKQFA